MSRSERGPVVAVGIDAAEPALVRSLMAQGALPCLRALAEGGAWARVTSPADIGSGAVWPTFMTGSAPRQHGICYDWPWDPDGMRIAHLTTSHLTPFWKAFALEGYAVGVVDVPFAPIAGVPRGIEISEWGSHDWLRGRLTVSPAARTDWVRAQGGVHPFATSPIDVWGPATPGASATSPRPVRPAPGLAARWPSGSWPRWSWTSCSWCSPRSTRART